MKASELIKELQERIDIYGDIEIIMRVGDNGIDDEDFNVMSVYGDEESERIVISDFDY